MMDKNSKRTAYQIVLSKEDEMYLVYIPDFDINTEGYDIANAIEMARDAIGLTGITMEDAGKKIPKPNTKPYKIKKGEFTSYVDIDFVEYRRRVDNRSIKKNCTIPYWLSVKADEAHINYSKVLQEALANLLGVKQNSYS